jgi:hypothetical protein
MTAKKGSDPSTGSSSSGTEHRQSSSRSDGMSDPLARWYNESASQSPYNIIAEVPEMEAASRHSKGHKGHKKHGK